ncbi:MAG: peptidyl-prolyl cis-trans isomerase [Ignavibacteriales bacterium]|nr:peptidyl-prolyl cis-trans isomerase [Ignavibacteriales bacterium]
MPCLKKLKNNLFIFFFTASLLTGCGEKPKPAVYLARVNDSYLTEQEFVSLYDSAAPSSSHTQELYQQWVKTEILYQKAIKEGITSDAKYGYLLTRAQKELAVAMLMQKIADDAKFSCSEEELRECYNQDKWQFVAGDKGYLYHLAVFPNEVQAEKFHRQILAGSWSSANKQAKPDSMHAVYLNVFKYAYQLESGLLFRLLSALSPGETSPPVNIAADRYMIVGLQFTLPPDSIPPLGAIKQLIEKRVIEKKKGDYIEKYLKDLYSESTVDILNPEF